MKKTGKMILALLLCAAMLLGVSAAAFADGSLSSAAGAPEITEQPDPYGWGVSYGELVTLSVDAEGDDLGYQWYYQKPGSDAWTKVVKGGTADTYEFKAYTRHDGYKYKCTVSNAFGSVDSEIVTLKVHTEIAVYEVTTECSVHVGETACVDLTAMGKSLRYQWYYQKPDSDTWTKVSAASGRTSCYEFTAAPRHNGYKFKCVISNEFGSFDTAEKDAVCTVHIIGAPEITAQPEDAYVNEDDVATFKVSAAGEGLSYQWYYQKPGSDAWTKIQKNGTSASYSLTAAPRHNGYKYKCVVKNDLGSVTSSVATLSVVAKPKIVAQPKSVSVGKNYSAKFSVVAEGDGLSYQWFYKMPGSDAWIRVKVNGTSATYVLKLAANHNGFRYKCVVTNSAGSVESGIATLTVK